MSGLELRFLGEFGVIRNGRPLSLPPSKKTRALLAYLGLSARRFRREHLCELLWEIPDDPRGSLRWSLTKLRRLIDDDEHLRIIADRNTVQIDTAGVTIDVTALQALAATLERASTEDLERAAERYSGNFLEGLEFSNFHDFHAWCVAEREQASRAQSTVLRELVRRLTGTPERALPYARALVGIVPYEEAARAALVRLLLNAQRLDEAEQQFQLGVRMLKEAGIVSSGALLQARRGPMAESPRSEVRLAARETISIPRAPVRDALIGRDAEAQQLADTLSRVLESKHAEILLVRGEPGIGKSRLLEHAAGLARDAGAYVLRASAFESEAIRPFALWIDAMRTTHPEAAQRIFGETQFENRDRLFSGLSELVACESAQRPTALIFDDVHWCDDSSAAALHYVARLNRECPVLGVLGARNAELQDNVPLQQALRSLRRSGLLRELDLGPLTDRSIFQLIEARVPGANSERLSGECGGNPLLAIELARAENEGGSRGSLEQLVRDRLARFDLDGAEVLRWAALLSPRIEVSSLAKLTGVDSSAVEAVLENAERQAILVSNDRGLAFSHELVARAIYTDISPVRRRVMHRRVAEWLEQDAGLELSRTSDLAHHATQSGDAGLAARAMVSAGRLCLRFFANDEALSLARRGLQLTERLPDAEQVRLGIELHDIILAASVLDDWEGAARRYVELAERALDHGAVSHARLGYHMAASVRWAHGQWADAREQTLQSVRVVQGADDDDQIAGMAETARCLVMLERDLSQADAMLMEAQSLAERKHASHRAIPAGLGMLRYYENRLDEAEALFQQSRALCKAAGDRLSEFQANEYLVMIDFQRGRYEAAKRRCDELLAIGSKLRDGSEAPFARALYGLCAYATGDDAAALDTALTDLRVADAKHRLAYVLTRAALLDYERKRVDTAIARADEALGYAKVLDRATELLLAHVVLARGCRAVDDNRGAKVHLDEVARLTERGVAAWARLEAERLTRATRRSHA
jgi:DNA-binding SARP family transcriptional activator/predicted ATPase